MDEVDRKTALRMIPYGIYVMTATGGDGARAAATVNWVTQTSFAPPLLALGVKADSGVYAAARSSGVFVLNMLGKGQQGTAFAFFKPSTVDGNTISGEPFRDGAHGGPVLENAHCAVECRVAQVVELGDHHTVIGEVVAVHVHKRPEGRPDLAILEMKDLGEKTFYGG